MKIMSQKDDIWMKRRKNFKGRKNILKIKPDGEMNGGKGKGNPNFRKILSEDGKISLERVTKPESDDHVEYSDHEYV